MKPEEVPDELARIAMEGYYGHAVPDGGFAALCGQWQRALAAVLPARDAQIEREVRAKIAAELRTDAEAHRRTAERRKVNAEILKRADTLEVAAARIERGNRKEILSGSGRGEA